MGGGGTLNGVKTSTSIIFQGKCFYHSLSQQRALSFNIIQYWKTDFSAGEHFNKKWPIYATLNPETFIDRRRGGGGQDRETKADANGDPVHATDRSGGFAAEVRSQKISEFVISQNKTGVCKLFLQNSAIICPCCAPVWGREGDGEEGRKEGGGRDWKRKVDTSWSFSFLSIWISAAAHEPPSELWANWSESRETTEEEQEIRRRRRRRAADGDQREKFSNGTEGQRQKCCRWVSAP